MKAPLPLFGADALADWIRAGGRPERSPPLYGMRLRWHTHWFEHNWQVSCERLQRLARPREPVFVLGLWRSGTTLLHELLHAATQWVTPRTWQCFSPSSCFLVRGPPAAVSLQRPMDQGRITTTGPQEDEFAQLLLGGPSVYRGFIDPRRLGECSRSLRPGDMHALERWESFIRGIAAGDAGSRLLLKSPSHSFRLPQLLHLFPAARFVWIGRHTGEVLASNRRMWSAMTGRYGLWSSTPAALDAFLERIVERCAEVLEEAVHAVPAEQLLWVDFTELQTQPRRVLQGVLEFLEAESDRPQRAQRIEQALQSVALHAGERAALPDALSVRRLEAAMSAARQRFGRSADAP